MPQANAILRAIEASTWSDVKGRCASVELERGELIQRPGEEIRHVYFPTTAVIAVGADTVAGESVNVTLLGREGALGVFEACGSRHTYSRATVQLAGQAWRMPAGTYRRLFSASHGLRQAIHMYVEMLLVEARQNVACNALHTVENRLARTLLEISHKRQALQLPITHHALSQFLGVQRTTIAASVTGLQRAGMVRSGRGMIEIVDRERLEAASCTCHETIAFVREDLQSRVEPVCEA